MSTKYKFMPSKEYLIEEYINKGKTFKDIALENGVNPTAVFYWMRKYDIQSRDKHHIVHPHNFTDAEKKAISERMKGKVVSLETRAKLSKARKIKGMGRKKTRGDGYVAIFYPSYPSANKEGFVMEHRFVMEQYIGRLLTNQEVVHHINHNRSDNRINNLMLMTISEHCKLHLKERYSK